MSTRNHYIKVSDLSVEVVRKDIKNLHVGVYPPHGRVRVAAPYRLDDEAIRLAIISRLGWIRRQQSSFIAQERQSKREMVTGESHFFHGRRYRLNVVENAGRPSVRIANNTTLELKVRPDTNHAKRLELLECWYRRQLRDQIPDLIASWEPVVGKEVSEWRIRKMKTRWGSCNIEARRIWLNLELVKKPISCLEFVLVHEMVHLLERKHNERFRDLMDQFMPDWNMRRDELNRAPLAHEDWFY